VTDTLDQTSSYIDLSLPEEVERIMSEQTPGAVIDFWSPTCGPCMAMAPDFEHVAREFVDEPDLKFYKVNVSEHPELAAPFGIRSVPTLMFVRRGKIADAIVGRVPAERLGQKAEWLLARVQKKGLLSRLFG